MYFSACFSVRMNEKKEADELRLASTPAVQIKSSTEMEEGRKEKKEEEEKNLLKSQRKSPTPPPQSKIISLGQLKLITFNKPKYF